ncbi:hypothetical protein CKO28_00415 [Rhodovibrio sodomensis]|uniref:Glyoxalase-related protein domain-containing protein n=1 Tax=Rhodovibrio sodomensis TaxID=1088 RepID=A0ABS1D9T4_9PROT|nr:glyoxalase superfamily protein [Rhodovibrio sodomensis]MBK1666503.1 hypothetical protein [Rhodovibrio sodomensis]
MHLKIDDTRAKSMARQLKTFLKAGGGKFAHVNALEATAQMLGFRNHNAMLAALEGTRAPVIKQIGQQPLAPGKWTLLSYGLIDVHTGEYEDEIGQVEIDLARTLSDPDLRAAIAAAQQGDGRISPRLLQCQPEIDALLAGLPLADDADIDSAAWLDVGDWAEELDQLMDALLELDPEREVNGLALIDDSQAHTLIEKMGAQQQSDPIDGDGRVVVNPVPSRDPDDAMRGRPDWEYRVVVHRDGAWRDMAGLESLGEALDVAAAFAGQPAARQPDAPARDPDTHLPVRFELHETPRFRDQQEQAIGSVLINGRPHHITLTRVADQLPEDADPDDPDADLAERQQPTDSRFDYRLEALQAFENTDDAFRPIEHDTGEYLCVITPYCR